MNNILERPFSWSFSRIRNYETCPRRYHEVDVLKNFKEEQSPQLRDGFLVHDALAKRIDKGVTLPSNMPFEKWAVYATNCDGDISVERKLAITRKFQPCDYFDRILPVWLRTVADVLRIDGEWAHIIDWKTGNIKVEEDQLKLIASCVMAHYPQVTAITAELVWLAHDTKTTREYTEDDIVKFWEHEMFGKVRKLQRAHQENNFPPNRSGLCKRYCMVVTCEHCGQ